MSSFPPFAPDTALDTGTVLDTPRNALKEPKSPAGPTSKLTIRSKQQLFAEFVNVVQVCTGLYSFAYRITTYSLDCGHWSVYGGVAP